MAYRLSWHCSASCSNAVSRYTVGSGPEMAEVRQHQVSTLLMELLAWDYVCPCGPGCNPVLRTASCCACFEPASPAAAAGLQFGHTACR